MNGSALQNITNTLVAVGGSCSSMENNKHLVGKDQWITACMWKHVIVGTLLLVYAGPSASTVLIELSSQRLVKHASLFSNHISS